MGLFSSLLYQVSKRHLAAFHFLCIVIYLLPSIQTLTNIAYMFGVALVIDIRWCFMHTKIIKIFIFFRDSVVFFVILHIVFASLAGHFYQINWATFCYVFVDFAKRQVESEMFCYSNIFPFGTEQVMEINTISKLHFDVRIFIFYCFNMIQNRKRPKDCSCIM